MSTENDLDLCQATLKKEKVGQPVSRTKPCVFCVRRGGAHTMDLASLKHGCVSWLQRRDA